MKRSQLILMAMVFMTIPALSQNVTISDTVFMDLPKEDGAETSGASLQYSKQAQQKISTNIISLPETKLWASGQNDLTGDFLAAEKGYLTGALFELKDSSILFSNKLVKEDYYTGNYAISEIFIEDIYLIKTQLPHFAKGLFIGAGFGASMGAFVGYASGDETGLLKITAEDKALCGAIVLGLVGSLVGGILGSLSFQVQLDGNVNKYHSKKAELERYTIKYSNK